MSAISRRAMLGGVGALSLAGTVGLAGCEGGEALRWSARWVGAQAERGHRLRDRRLPATPSVQRRASVIVVGGGIAGLGCARALQRAGIDDVSVLELEASAGGNSRGHMLGGRRCPLGAHYLPLPGDDAVEVVALLDELGLRRQVSGKPSVDERHLCHSPQERLFIDGAWRDGLLPPIDALPPSQRAATLAQYRRFGDAVAQASRADRFTLPTARAPWSDRLAALDAVPFARWLDERGFDAPALRWVLDYACRDDYGAGAAQVSAWAGLHYFASRHGFHAPGEGGDERDAVLTWPEGNAWLAERLAAPLGERVRADCVVFAVREQREGVELDVWDALADRVERWRADQVVLAVPLFVAARLLDAGTALRAPLDAAVASMRWAPWLVANLLLDTPLTERRGGAPLAWDNVLYDSPALGYVDATHQSLAPVADARVLTAYWALGGRDAAALTEGRRALLGDTAQAWAGRVVADLAAAHPDLRLRLRQVDLMRHGHAMSVPAPGVRSHPALAALAALRGPLHVAHADLAGYSVFEEALFHGERAARAVLAAWRRAPARGRIDAGPSGGELPGEAPGIARPGGAVAAK